MADEEPEPVAAPAAGPRSPLLPVLIGVVVLIGLAVGVTLFVLSLFAPPADVVKAADQATVSTVIDPKTTREILIGDLITNIANQDGRRYVKLTCAVWMSAQDAARVTGSGGDGEIQIKRLMQMTLEEQLKRYELADLTGRGIIATLTQDFTVVLEDMLHAQFTDRPKDHRFVRRVLLNNLLVQ